MAELNEETCRALWRVNRICRVSAELSQKMEDMADILKKIQDIPPELEKWVKVVEYAEALCRESGSYFSLSKSNPIT